MLEIGILEKPIDVIERLLDLDYELNELAKTGELTDKLRFVILGGTALLLYNKNPRVTSDIDVIYFESEEINKSSIKDVLKGYNISPNIKNVMQFPFKEEIFKRMKPISVTGVQFDNLDAYLASKEDVILSKLFSTRIEDEQDLIKTDIMDDADMDYVRKQFNLYKDSFLSFHKPDLDFVIKLRQSYIETLV